MKMFMFTSEIGQPIWINPEFVAAVTRYTTSDGFHKAAITISSGFVYFTLSTVDDVMTQLGATPPAPGAIVREPFYQR